MQEMTQVWKDIFSIHKYFYDSNFTFSFLQNYYQDLRDRYNDIGQRANLYDVYSTITNKPIPSNSFFTSKDFKDIEYFIIDNLDLEDLFYINSFDSLKQLKANSNRIDSIISLKKFIDFSFIDVSGNKISNIQPLNKFNKLRHLNLGENSIFDVTPLSNLENLWTLDIQGNKIEFLPDLSHLTVLQELYIGSNKIKSLHGLTKLAELRTLHLGLNPLSDEELVSIKKALPNCKIIFEYYPPDDEGIGKYVELNLFEEIVFMTENHRYHNESFHTVYYLPAENNKKAHNINILMKRLIENIEDKNSYFVGRKIKRKHFWSDTDLIVSCQLEY